jgi:hypothetical protein
MNPKTAHHLLKRLELIKPGYFVIAIAVFAVFSVYGLRQNNFKMIELREAVVQADQQNGDVESALKALREHVHGHMNTNLASGEFAIKPPIQLKARYERLMAQNTDKANKANVEIAARGEAMCAERFPAAGLNPPRVACLQDYMSVNAIKPQPVPDALYKFDFVSPRWSPDLAGWSLVGLALSSILLAIRIAASRVLKAIARK